MEIKDLEGYSLSNGLTKKVAVKTEIDITKPGFIQKNLTSLVDFTLVLLLRIIISIFLVFIWYAVKIKKIMVNYSVNETNIGEFVLKFGILYDLALIAFLTVVMGGLYYIFFYASKRGATPGCRINNLKLVNKKEGGRISLAKSALRYFLYLLPAVFIIVILFKYYIKSFDIIFFALIILTMVWYDLSFFFRLRQSVPDIICGTILISSIPINPSSNKFSFFKFKNKS